MRNKKSVSSSIDSKKFSEFSHGYWFHYSIPQRLFPWFFFFDRNSRSKDLLQKLHCNKLKIWMSWHFLNWFAWIRNVDDDVVVEKCIEKDAQWKASNGTNLFQDQLKSSLCLHSSVCVCMCTVVNCEIAFINSMRIGNCGGCFSIYFIYLVPVVY